MRIILFTLLFSSTSFAVTEQTVLSVGRSIEWKVPAGTPITLSNGSIARVSDLGSKVKIVGKKSGTAILKAGSAMLEIHVMPEESRRLHESLQATVSEMRGLLARVEGKQIVVTGRLLRFADWLSLANSAGSQSAEYSFRADIEPELKAQARAHFQKVLRDSHLPELPISVSPSAVVTVPAEPAELRTQVTKTLAPYGFRVDTSRSALTLEPMIRVKLIVAEFRKTASSKIGIEWPEAGNAQLLPGLRFPAGLSATIHALEKNGLAKVLASPTLLCRSGKEAQFLAGGELPIKVTSHKVRDIVWKKYGVMMKLKPLADFSGRMSIAIETEVSAIDYSLKVDDMPAMMTNRIETHFDLSSSRTIVLSGLIKKEWSESAAGLPGLVNLPVLGPLFGSRDFIDKKTELVVFVTPEIAQPDKDEL